MQTALEAKRSRGTATPSAQAIRVPNRWPRKGVPVRTYEDLIAALRDRRKQLGLTQEEVNAIAGFHDGYVNKLEIGYRDGGRGVGAMSLPTWLDTLGVCLLVVPLCVEKKR